MPHIFVLALAAAFYPALLAGVVMILMRPRPAKLLLAFYIGGMLVSVSFGVAIVRWLHDSGIVQPSNHVTRPIVDIVAGVLSLGVAAAVWRGRMDWISERRARRREARPERPSWTARALGRESMLIAFAVGVVLNLPGVWYLAALADIAEAKLSVADELALILGFNLVMFLLVEVPLLMYLFDPLGTQRRVEAFSAWIQGHVRQIAVTIATGVGVWLITKGIVGALG